MDKFKKGLKAFFFSFAWLFILLFSIDIVTKLVVSHNLAMNANDHIDLIPGFLRISYTTNPNAAFGMGFASAEANRIIYIVLAVLAIGGLTFYYIKRYKNHPGIIKACLILIITGAFGNLIDRLFYSFTDYCVIDWIDFYGIWQYNFNIADSCIVVSVFMMIIYLIISEIKEFNAKRKLEVKTNNEKTLSSEEKARQDRDEADKK